MHQRVTTPLTSNISNFDDLTSEAYANADADEKKKFFNNSLIIAGKLGSAMHNVPVARSIVTRALQPNDAGGIEALPN